jgi:glucose-1-phosphate adenylyltransferase
MMNNVAAVILAGGRGKRMDILCQERPKPVLPFAGRFKVIDFSLSNCIYSQLGNIYVMTDYRRSSMAEYLSQWSLANASSVNFRVLEPRNGSYNGTADAVYQNLDCFDKRQVDTVLVLAGDHIYKLDYRRMLAFHREVNADVTVGVIPVPVEQAYRFGTVTVDANGRVLDFLEKSSVPQSNLASMGIYVFNRGVLNEALIEDARKPMSLHDFGYSLLPDMVKRDRVFAYRFGGYWRDIGTVEAYYKANMELTGKQPCFSLNGTSQILTLEPGLPPPHIGRQASIQHSLVSPGCVVRGKVENSILSPRVWVDEQAVVRNSVIMENTFIGRHSIIDNSVLDEGVSIGEQCNVGCGPGLVQSYQDITVVGKGVTVPPRITIERSCKVSPHIGLSDFGANHVIGSVAM